MQINLPEVASTLEKLLQIESEFDKKKEKISVWVDIHKKELSDNKFLLKNKSDKNDIKVLNIFLHNLLVRAIKGEAGNKIYTELEKSIKSINDLNDDNYYQILKKSGYRWKNDGVQVIKDVVIYFKEKLSWNWDTYLKEANKYKDENFPSDEILKIKNIGYKLRDLALSNFNSNYAAFDLHVTRVVTRIGWLNLGYDLLNDNFEMGNNPSNPKNYLFLHRLFIKLSEMPGVKFTPVDLDRIFWHLGRSLCGNLTNCRECPISNNCLTGKARS